MLIEDEQLLFCGSDVAKALGYAVPRKALYDHCKGVLKRNTLTNGGMQEMSFIPEGDVYRLIVHSKLPDGYILQGFRRKRLQTLRFSLLTQPDFNLSMIILEEYNT